MSATSNKSRMFLLLMIAISLVFFMASFVAAAISNEQQPAPSSTAAMTPTPEQAAALKGCMAVRTGENMLTDCSP
ncbi:MAG TPA: hypothetical protein VFT58_04985 [Nitrososphaera sp.]|nr:hypothetical protein [Nitrososphaera sp.]